MYTVSMPPRCFQHLETYRARGLDGLDLPLPLGGIDDCQAIRAQLVCHTESASDYADFIANTIDAWESWSIGRNSITRFEFLYREPDDEKMGLQGAVLYDSNDIPFAHIVNALLGYDGNGPSFSGALLEAVRVPTEVFKGINAQAKRYRDSKTSYVAVVELDQDNYEWHSAFYLE